MLKATEEGSWEAFQEIPAEDNLATYPVGLDKSGQTLYMVDSRNRNTAALMAFDLSSEEETLLAEHAQADASRTQRHPTEGYVQAVSFNYKRQEWQALDDAVANDLAYLKTVADGEIEIFGRTVDDSYWIVAYVMDNGPVRYYRYDRTAQDAQFLFTNRPDWQDLPLANMVPLVIQSRDGLNLVSYLTLPVGSDSDGDARPDETLPMVLLVHGGP